MLRSEGSREGPLAIIAAMEKSVPPFAAAANAVALQRFWVPTNITLPLCFIFSDDGFLSRFVDECFNFNLLFASILTDFIFS